MLSPQTRVTQQIEFEVLQLRSIRNSHYYPHHKYTHERKHKPRKHGLFALFLGTTCSAPTVFSLLQRGGSELANDILINLLLSNSKLQHPKCFPLLVRRQRSSATKRNGPQAYRQIRSAAGVLTAKNRQMSTSPSNRRASDKVRVIINDAVCVH